MLIPTSALLSPSPSLSIEDGRLADDFRDRLRREGQVADWAALPGGHWLAWVGDAARPRAGVGLGSTRTSALAAAHLEVIRRTAPRDIDRPDQVPPPVIRVEHPFVVLGEPARVESYS